MNPKIKALLVDDERLARKWLASLLHEHPGVTIAGEASSVKEAARLAQALSPDVVFLDIQMPPENGFDLLPLLMPLPKVVFVTAHDQFAVRAFDAHALDYLLKPVHPERLAETIRKLHDSRPDAPVVNVESRLSTDDLLPLRDGRTLRVVRVREIAFVEAEGAYTRVHLAHQRPMILLRSLQEWETLLPSSTFARVGRSLILNLARVRSSRSVNRDETYLEIEGAETVQLGRLAAARLRKLMQEHRHGLPPQDGLGLSAAG